jgi:hypothetical protein
MTARYVDRHGRSNMAVANWIRLKQSPVMDYGAELPARVVLEHDEEDHSYRTYLETVSVDGKLSFKAPRFHYWLEDAVEDYRERLGLG